MPGKAISVHRRAPPFMPSLSHIQGRQCSRQSGPAPERSTHIPTLILELQPCIAGVSQQTATQFATTALSALQLPFSRNLMKPFCSILVHCCDCSSCPNAHCLQCHGTLQRRFLALIRGNAISHQAQRSLPVMQVSFTSATPGCWQTASVKQNKIKLSTPGQARRGSGKIPQGTAIDRTVESGTRPSQHQSSRLEQVVMGHPMSIAGLESLQCTSRPSKAQRIACALPAGQPSAAASRQTRCWRGPCTCSVGWSVRPASASAPTAGPCGAPCLSWSVGSARPADWTVMPWSAASGE